MAAGAGGGGAAQHDVHHPPPVQRPAHAASGHGLQHRATARAALGRPCYALLRHVLRGVWSGVRLRQDLARGRSTLPGLSARHRQPA